MSGFAAGLRLTVIGKSGAVVRREADLGSPVVATLARGETCTASGETAALTVSGRVKERVRLAAPCDGWLSATMVTESVLLEPGGPITCD